MRQSAQSMKFKVGLFVLIGLFITVGTIIWLGSSHYLAGADYYVTYFQESVQGLQADSAVKYRGVEVGRVISINVAPDSRLVEVTMAINFSGPLDEVMQASLKMTGITGIAYIEMDIQDPNKFALQPKLTFKPPYPVIPSYPSGLAQIFTVLDKVLTDMNSINFKVLAKEVSEIIHAVKTLVQDEHIKRALVSLESALQAMEEGSVAFTRLISQADRQNLATEAKQVLTQATELLAATKEQLLAMNLPQAGQKADAVLSTVNNNTAAIMQNLQITVDSIRRAAESLERLAARLEASPSDLIFSKPPSPQEHERAE